ncbi:hypothetical protein [Lactiplantibacillus plantarum]|uniref:hypothetical protein n=1 Tax=Lactiplantibacillus plantarum TaxID=1590 RepID=UPI001BA6FA7E|nr:hypothetical protein [Lactiplantibacillus plantarum]MBS0953582.1 hypothetical protein [Lactiplantibacillus plantarum]MBS0956829.1 hypothetical protein [Lactiplantibacillus plantarum]
MNNIKKTIRQINAQLPDEDNSSKVIGFVTPGSRSAQQTIVANLAIMYGQAGDATLIIDTDFGSTVFSETFNLNNKIGVSDFLNNRSVNVENIISQIPSQNVSLISSGTLKKNETSYLLGDPRFNVLVNELIDKYDKILINTSVMTKYDSIANELKMVDGVILVVNSEETKKKQMFKLMQSLHKQQVKVLGYINAKRN